MTEIKTYIQGQEIEPVEETRVYVHKDVLKYLELYQEIGTIPQLRALKEDRDKCFLEIQQYRAIGTVEEFKALKEKSIPKKVIHLKYTIKSTGRNKHIMYCGVCGKYNQRVCERDNYCRNCGTKIDWQ